MGLEKPRAWSVAAAATLVMTVSYVDRQTLAALAPVVRPALGLSQTQYGFVTAAFSVAYLIFAPVSGAFIDVIGPRRAILAAVSLWSIVAALHALLPGAPWGFAALLAARVALGAAEAPSFPAAAHTIQRVLPAGQRGAGFGLLFTGSSIGGTIVAPIAIAIQVRYGWRAAFALTAAIGASWLPLWWRLTRRAEVRAALDAREDAVRKRRVSREDASALARAVVLIVASAPGIMFVLNWFPQLLRDALRVPQHELPRYLWFPPLLFDLGSVGLGALAGRRASGERRDLVLVAALLASALFFVPRAESPLTATALGGAVMMGGGALYSLLFGELAARVPRERLGAASGVCASAQSLSHVLAAPLVGGGIDAAHGSYDRVLEILGLLALPGALLWILWPRVSAR